MATRDTGSDVQAARHEWLQRLESLVRDVKSWAEGSGWKTRRITKPLEEGELGSYRVPVLLMEKETVEVVLNPVARLVPGAEGAVDLYRAPAYDDIVSLYYEPDRGGWVVHQGDYPGPSPSESIAETTPRPFTEATIRSILDAMTPAHA